MIKSPDWIFTKYCNIRQRIRNYNCGLRIVKMRLSGMHHVQMSKTAYFGVNHTTTSEVVHLDFYLTKYSGVRSPRLGLINRFTEGRAWRTFIYHLRYLQASTFPKYTSHYIIIKIQSLPLRSHICRTRFSAHHLSRGSSMVSGSYQSSEGCGFDPRLGLRNRFSERVWRTLICHS